MFEFSLGMYLFEIIQIFVSCNFRICTFGRRINFNYCCLFDSTIPIFCVYIIIIIINFKGNFITIRFSSNLFGLIETGEWNNITNDQMPSRTEHASVMHQSKMYIVGGYSSQQGYRNDIITIDFGTNPNLKFQKALIRF